MTPPSVLVIIHPLAAMVVMTATSIAKRMSTESVMVPASTTTEASLPMEPCQMPAQGEGGGVGVGVGVPSRRLLGWPAWVTLTLTLTLTLALTLTVDEPGQGQAHEYVEDVGTDTGRDLGRGRG